MDLQPMRGTTIACPICGGWEHPGRSCPEPNPVTDVAAALAREVQETERLRRALQDANTAIGWLCSMVCEGPEFHGAVTVLKAAQKDALKAAHIINQALDH